MPELPEVETVRRGLRRALVGAAVSSVQIFEPRLRWPVPSAQLHALVGARLLEIERRSKYLLFRFDRGTLLAHLGMTGSFTVTDEHITPPRRKHDHVEFQFERALCVRYHDPRRFGSMHWMEGDIHPLLDALGPEPLSDAFDGNVLHAALRNRAAPIKSALMDNHVVVGVGNIYANEALFRAGIHPNRAAKSLSLTRCIRLADEVKKILAEAIAAGGSTLRDFVNSAGEPGYFQQSYFVYGRADAPCKICAEGTKNTQNPKTRTILTMRHNGRATFYCPKCQR